jgi:ankyrin repeat protein
VLLAAGESVDPGDSWPGQTPLMWAAAEGHPTAMRSH